MKYLRINNYNLPYPKAFEMRKEPNIVCELTTMTGSKVADVNGWRWADTTIEWGALYQEDLTLLLQATASPTLTIAFENMSGGTTTVNAILKGFVGKRTLAVYDGDTVWEGVAIAVSFPDCYEY